MKPFFGDSFSIQVIIVDFFPNCSGCGGEYIKNDGFITSPNYPENYPASSNCQYLIKTDGFNEIVLTFQDFDLEPHKECRYDYVQVRNGGNIDSEIIGKYCGDDNPGVIKSTGTALLIEFVSDTNTQATGFKASWKMKKKVSEKVEGKKPQENIIPAGIYLLKVSKRNTRTMYEICSKLTIKTPKQR